MDLLFDLLPRDTLLTEIVTRWLDPMSARCLHLTCSTARALITPPSPRILTGYLMLEHWGDDLKVLERFLAYLPSPRSFSKQRKLSKMPPIAAMYQLHRALMDGLDPMKESELVSHYIEVALSGTRPESRVEVFVDFARYATNVITKASEKKTNQATPLKTVLRRVIFETGLEMSRRLNDIDLFAYIVSTYFVSQRDRVMGRVAGPGVITQNANEYVTLFQHELSTNELFTIIVAHMVSMWRHSDATFIRHALALLNRIKDATHDIQWSNYMKIVISNMLSRATALTEEMMELAASLVPGVSVYAEMLDLMERLSYVSQPDWLEPRGCADHRDVIDLAVKKAPWTFDTMRNNVMRLHHAFSLSIKNPILPSTVYLFRRHCSETCNFLSTDTYHVTCTAIHTVDVDLLCYIKEHVPKQSFTSAIQRIAFGTDYFWRLSPTKTADQADAFYDFLEAEFAQGPRITLRRSTTFAHLSLRHIRYLLEHGPTNKRTSDSKAYYGNVMVAAMNTMVSDFSTRESTPQRQAALEEIVDLAWDWSDSPILDGPWDLCFLAGSVDFAKNILNTMGRVQCVISRSQFVFQLFYAPDAEEKIDLFFSHVTKHDDTWRIGANGLFQSLLTHGYSWRLAHAEAVMEKYPNCFYDELAEEDTQAKKQGLSSY